MRRVCTSLAFRTTVTVSVMGYLRYTVGIDALWERFVTFDLRWGFVVLGLALVGTVVSAYKWWITLRAMDLSLPSPPYSGCNGSDSTTTPFSPAEGVEKSTERGRYLASPSEQAWRPFPF